MVSYNATVFIRHGQIKVHRLKDSWLLTFRIAPPRSRADSISTIAIADSQSQRDEYIQRIRQFAEIID